MVGGSLLNRKLSDRNLTSKAPEMFETDDMSEKYSGYNESCNTTASV